MVGACKVVAIALVLALGGCATASQPNPQPTEKVLARTNAGETDDLASSKGRTACQSKGTLEEKLNGLVAKRLGS